MCVIRERNVSLPKEYNLSDDILKLNIQTSTKSVLENSENK
jgi:hypothetical protein